MKKTLNIGFALIVALGILTTVYAADTPSTDNNHCIGAGPQAPRDIDLTEGTNPTLFRLSNNIDKMNLCNIHYHRNAEHKSAEYSTFIDTGDYHSGWACVEPDPDRELNEIGHTGVAPGDTIEVHWVHTSCDVNYADIPAGSGLGACLTDTCANPQLRVIAQVFTVDEHGEVTSLEDPMEHNDKTVVYTGSTTGPTYNNYHCSPFQVTWDVKKTCGSLDDDTLEDWSEENGEHAHGVRELVTPLELLSEIQNPGQRKK